MMLRSMTAFWKALVAGLLGCLLLTVILVSDLTAREKRLAGPFAEEVDTSARSDKISPALQATLDAGSEVSFLVILEEQADLGFVTGLQTKETKGRAVYDMLRNVALRSQVALRQHLDARGIAYRPFYIVNMLAVYGGAGLAEELTGWPEVARLEANVATPFRLPVSEPLELMDVDQSAEIEWGVTRIHADVVWDLGYTGQGIVVAGQDTGYEWDHPALKMQYRGWQGTAVVHDYNWHDAIHQDDPHTPAGNPCGFSSPEPCDDHSHGTHTMGTIVGDDGGAHQIGVAPGARWIGCRNMEQGWGTAATYAECFEFFLAPYPVGGSAMIDGDPTRAPHVINNSWTCPASEGCDVTSLRMVVENVRAAGILVVASAGNAGSGCATVNAPPALHDAVFTVGATTEIDQIASFSSRGPVTVDASNRPKPDISAPGVNVLSSVLNGGYGYKSGTSMAAPHVAGLVALLWSAGPHLVGEVDLTEDLIRDSARPVLDTTCGGDTDGHPNNVYGWGIVDALAAMQGELKLAGVGEPHWANAGSVVTYTFAVSSTAALSPATGVVLSDSLPLSTTFAWASGEYNRVGDKVVWDLRSVPNNGAVTATLAVTLDSALAMGTSVVNADYAVRSDQVPTPVLGTPVTIYVPWSYIFPVTFTSWP
jgi:serine protease AprX